jgi:hypothetical protein
MKLRVVALAKVAKMKVELIFRKKIDKWLDKIKILKDRQTIIELEVLIQIPEAQFREVVNIIFIILTVDK